MPNVPVFIDAPDDIEATSFVFTTSLDNQDSVYSAAKHNPTIFSERDLDRSVRDKRGKWIEACDKEVSLRQPDRRRAAQGRPRPVRQDRLTTTRTSRWWTPCSSAKEKYPTAASAPRRSGASPSTRAAA